jgi:hypothetical protein
MFNIDGVAYIAKENVCFVKSNWVMKWVKVVQPIS